MKLESKFKAELKKEIAARLPGCIITNLDPNDIQGIPDMLVLWNDRWATLEGKRTNSSSHRPNQDYYVEKMNKMSYSAIIYPENKEEILNEMERALRK